MRITLRTFNTIPSKRDHFWQIVLIPTISVLNSISTDDKYIALNLEWLFWSFTILFENGDTKR
jgi:hypothetical protein